jgi:hypothetical protein
MLRKPAPMWSLEEEHYKTSWQSNWDSNTDFSLSWFYKQGERVSSTQPAARAKMKCSSYVQKYYMMFKRELKQVMIHLNCSIREILFAFLTGLHFYPWLQVMMSRISIVLQRWNIYQVLKIKLNICDNQYLGIKTDRLYTDLCNYMITGIYIYQVL